MCVVGQDVNHGIFPIAYVVMDVEDKENWKWFLTLLHQDLGDYSQLGWNFMFDIQKINFSLNDLACIYA